MRWIMFLAMALAGVLPGAVADDSLWARDVIRERSKDDRTERARSLLATEVVDLEFRMQEDQTADSMLLTPRGYQAPAQQTRLQTRMKSQVMDGLNWESGVDLSLRRQTRLDVNTGEEVSETWQPEYLQKLTYQPWQGAEWTAGQTMTLEPAAGEHSATEFWKSSIAYRQTLGQLTEFKLESGLDRRAASERSFSYDREWGGASLSQGLGSEKVKWKVAGRKEKASQGGAQGYNRRWQRQETGVEWQPVPRWSVYTGAATEQEIRSDWVQAEDLLLYEFRSKWSLDPLFDLSGGLSLDTRTEQHEAQSGGSLWQLRGDLRASPDMLWSTRMQWEQRERQSAAAATRQREEKFFVGSGPSVKLDEGTRFGAEYGVTRQWASRAGGAGGESLVEHMLSLVLSAEF
jgi:hypothetical protein